MASPTEGEIQTQLKNAVAILDNLLQAQTVSANMDTYLQSLEGDFVGSQASGADAARSLMASWIVSGGRAMIDPILISYCHHIVGVPERDVFACLDRLYTHFNAGSLDVDERTFTRGAVSAVTGTGNGTVRRLTVDENGEAIESTHADVITVKCIADANTGALVHEELFEIRGTNAPFDLLDMKTASTQGSGAALRSDVVRSVSSRDSIALNSSFDNVTVAAGQPTTGSPVTLASGDTVDNWTVDDITAITSDVDTLYRSTSGVTTPKKMTLGKNCVLTQTFANANIALDPNRPYWYQIALRRRASATGTFTVAVGAQSVAQDISSLSNDTWTVLPAAIDANLWTKNLTQTAADINLTMASLATGTLEVDDLVIVPMFAFDNQWFTNVGGSTAYLLDDLLTFTDTISSDTKIQKWLWLLYQRYLPSDSSSPTLPDPA